MKKWLVASVILAIVSSGCQYTHQITLQNDFVASEVSYIHEEGTNAIEGNAFIRKRNGDVVTCAGREVSLIPAGEYARERMRSLYGSDSRMGYGFGFSFLSIRADGLPAARFSGLAPKISAAPAGYAEHQRRTLCDSDGRFEFANLPAGGYYVTTTVMWNAPGLGGAKGGPLMHPVVFESSDETRRVVLTDRLRTPDGIASAN